MTLISFLFSYSPPPLSQHDLQAGSSRVHGGNNKHHDYNHSHSLHPVEGSQNGEWEAHVTTKLHGGETIKKSLGKFTTKDAAEKAVEMFRKRNVEKLDRADSKQNMQSLMDTSKLLIGETGGSGGSGIDETHGTHSGVEHNVKQTNPQTKTIVDSESGVAAVKKNASPNQMVAHHEVHAHVTGEEFSHVKWQVVYQYLPIRSEKIYARRLARQAIDPKWGMGAREGLGGFLCHKWCGWLASCPDEVRCCWRKSTWVVQLAIDSATLR